MLGLSGARESKPRDSNTVILYHEFKWFHRILGLTINGSCIPYMVSGMGDKRYSRELHRQASLRTRRPRQSNKLCTRPRIESASSSLNYMSVSKHPRSAGDNTRAAMLLPSRSSTFGLFYFEFVFYFSVFSFLYRRFLCVPLQCLLWSCTTDASFAFNHKYLEWRRNIFLISEV